MSLVAASVHRPVFVVVLTLLLVLVGGMSAVRLPIQEYPNIKPPVVSVRTVYPGASASVLEADVTTPLEDALSGIPGLKTITSESREETSTVTLEFVLGASIDQAANEVRDRLGLVRALLPLGIQEPAVFKTPTGNMEVLWVALSSARHSQLELSEAADRVVRARLVLVPGVATAALDGERRYAMRVWVDPDRLAARQLTVTEVEEALRAQSVSIPAGRIESAQMEFGVSLQGALQTPAEFESLVIATREGYPVRLKDVARVELNAENTRMIGRFEGAAALGISVARQSTANTLAVARAVKALLPAVAAALPEGMILTVAWDGSLPIEQSLHEVYVALGISLLLVVLVILTCLGTVRATLVPTVAIPLSILGACAALALTGSSLNLLTLLGLVLAVGLVVDDAIIVLEHIHQRMSEGMAPRQAAVVGTQEMAFAVLATTITLVVVFVPIAFVPGLVGHLFTELAIAMGAAVLWSGVVALTVTPMLCGRWLRAETGRGAWTWGQLSWMRALHAAYGRALRWVVARRGLVLAGSLGVSLGSLALLTQVPMELAPLEDVGWFASSLVAPQGATVRYTDGYARELETMIRAVPEVAATYVGVGRGGVNRALSWVTLRDWADRQRSQQEIVAALNQQLGALAGVKAVAVNPPSMMEWSEKPPVQLVLGGLEYAELRQVAEQLVARLAQSPGLVAPELDLMVNTPHLSVTAHRDKAADLGVSMGAIGRTLETMLSGRPVGTFSLHGRQYKVIVKVEEAYRTTPADIRGLSVRGQAGELVQLSNLVTVQEAPVPAALMHVDRLRAVTVQAGIAEGWTLGQALEALNQAARAVVPPSMHTSYAGESKTFMESAASLSMTFGLALVVIYLVLAAQFESFRHPFTILVAVPPALSGAALALVLAQSTLSIYSQIGLVMLLGLVTKNAILIVEFANQLVARGQSRVEAVIEAALGRVRPILMTTAATILGALPLAIATGAGAASRRQIGLVLISGLCVSTLVTFVVVPAAYVLVSGRDRKSSEPVS
ncbi:MAG: efflux RND transporter permease subunit [Nitrospira sp.]|nr:efflux RND transporter permease subunit [Nitrospira sp.]